MFSEKRKDEIILNQLKSLPVLGHYQFDQTQAFLISEVKGITFIRFSSSSHALIMLNLENELEAIGVEYDPESHYLGIGFSKGNATEIQLRVRHVMPNFDLEKIKNLIESQSLGISCKFIT